MLKKLINTYKQTEEEKKNLENKIDNQIDNKLDNIKVFKGAEFSPYHDSYNDKRDKVSKEISSKFKGNLKRLQAKQKDNIKQIAEYIQQNPAEINHIERQEDILRDTKNCKNENFGGAIRFLIKKY